MLTSYLSSIAQHKIQSFLREHENDDEKVLVLKQKEINGIPSSLIALQLSGRRKAKSKLPTWHKTEGIIYPLSINLEQCSSEATAIFKSHVIDSIVSRKAIAADLTGGFGVDAFYLSSLFHSVHYIEPNKEIVEISEHNHKMLNAANISYHCLSAEDFIRQTSITFDLIYIDPSRRDEQSRRVYRLADCVPDITQLQSVMFDKCRFILLKASPLLDIQQGLREIQQVRRICIASVNNDCKELLFLSEKNYDGEPLIEAVDLFENGMVRSSFTFTLSEERNAKVISGDPDRYLYEPNASILKSGAFKLIAEKFNTIKLDASTHLYTSSAHVSGFPGKTFLIECLNPDSKQLKELLPDGKVNVVSRNYPLTTEEIKRKWHLRDGGEKFLIGFSSSKKKHLALCSRVISN
jgi:hypothetical protein